MSKKEDQNIRFWRKTQLNTESGCIEWTAACNKAGYGMFVWSGKTTLTHRLAWRMAKGDIPEGMNVLHSCDNPPCLNPEHLFLGTLGDNNRDRHAKGRSAGPRGAAHGNTALTENDIAYIREMRGKVFQRVLALYYGVTQSNIAHIQLGRSWNVVPIGTINEPLGRWPDRQAA
jgi:hypothetical protein